MSYDPIRELKHHNEKSLKMFNADGFDLFTKKNGFTRYALPGRASLPGALKYHWRLDRYRYGYKRRPSMDHAVIFRNPVTGVNMLVFHPYINPHLSVSDALQEIKAGLQEWAEKRGLKVEVYDPSFSWYYPGQTALVVISRQNYQIQVG